MIGVGPKPERPMGFFAPNFQMNIQGALNGYVVGIAGMPPCVVEVRSHTPQEFEKVLDAIREGFLQVSQPKN